MSACVVRAGDGDAAGADSPGPSPARRSLTQNRPDRQARSSEVLRFSVSSGRRSRYLDKRDRLVRRSGRPRGARAAPRLPRPARDRAPGRPGRGTCGPGPRRRAGSCRGRAGRRPPRVEHRAVVERHRDPVGDSRGIAGGQRRVLDHGRPRDEVEQGGVGEPLGGELRGRDLAVDERDGRAVGEAVIGRLARPRPPLLGVLADDLDGRPERRDLDRPDPTRVADPAAGARTRRRWPTGCDTRPGRT